MPARDFAVVYDNHIWQIYGFFAYRLRSRADAEDLTQQTFERALRSWGRYDASKASVATWLLVIARNLLVDHFRADRTSRTQPLDGLEVEGEHLEASPDRPDLGLDPDLERALATLGDREREIVALRFGGDLSGPEIAEAMGLSLANVQQILSRSLRRMRAELDAREPVRPPADRPPQRLPRR
ncbi:MAG: sigma-70 family RNA polymerase sigma factor [Solirubrobacteraceae bacterium]|nr:sigma-70 family RNA polymerase sigma factor [Solirubrobacteraceae bacterium]